MYGILKMQMMHLQKSSMLKFAFSLQYKFCYFGPKSPLPLLCVFEQNFLHGQHAIKMNDMFLYFERGVQLHITIKLGPYYYYFLKMLVRYFKGIKI